MTSDPSNDHTAGEVYKKLRRLARERIRPRETSPADSAVRPDRRARLVRIDLHQVGRIWASWS